MFKVPYSSSIPGLLLALLFKKSSTKYDVVYPELLSNGTIDVITRKLMVKEFDVIEGTFNDIGTYDIDSASGYANPISFRSNIGYDFDNDRILLVIGEWDGSSTDSITTKAKLIAISRDLSEHQVLIDDILALVKTVVSDADNLRYFGQAFIHSQLAVLVAGVYSGSYERSVIIVSTDGGESWEVIRANSRYDFIQQRIEPIWDGSTFIGFLTEGHGTNSHWIKTDGTVVAGSPGGLFTTEPIYDPVNNKVIWIEWGGATGATQHIWIADPASPFDASDVTPTGTITDNEGNSIDLSTVCKIGGIIYSDGQRNKFMFNTYRGGVPSGEKRIIATDLPIHEDNEYDIVVDSNNNDRWKAFVFNPYIRAIDIASKKIVTSPLITAVPI